MLQEIKDVDFESKVIKKDGNILVEFYSPECAPCKIVNKTLSNITNNDVKIFTMNIFKCPNASSRLSIMSVPTVVSFKNGKIIGYITGNRKVEDYMNTFKENV